MLQRPVSAICKKVKNAETQKTKKQNTNEKEKCSQHWSKVVTKRFCELSSSPKYKKQLLLKKTHFTCRQRSQLNNKVEKQWKHPVSASTGKTKKMRNIKTVSVRCRFRSLCREQIHLRRRCRSFNSSRVSRSIGGCHCTGSWVTRGRWLQWLVIFRLIVAERIETNIIRVLPVNDGTLLLYTLTDLDKKTKMPYHHKY